MFRKLNSKLLLIALIGLLAIVAGVYLNDKSRGERSFKESLVQTDSNRIDLIQLLPKSADEVKIEFKKNGNNWTVSQNGTSYPADNLAITELLNSLNPLKTESVVSTNPNHFKDFDLIDSLATRIKLIHGTKIVADLLIGKMETSSNQTLNSYVRLYDDKVVYAVAGYLSMHAARGLNTYRSHLVVEGSKADWSKLEFIYPADSSFILEKQSEGKWHIGNSEINSLDIDKFLDPLQHLTCSNFSSNLPPSQPRYKLKISGYKLTTPIELVGYVDNSNNIVIKSSLNSGNLFDGKELIDKIFPRKNAFFNK